MSKSSLFKKGEVVTMIYLRDKITGLFAANEHIVTRCGEKQMTIKNVSSGFADSSFSGGHIGFAVNRSDDGRPDCHYDQRGVFKRIVNPETLAKMLKRCQAQWLRFELKKNLASYDKHQKARDTSPAYLSSCWRDISIRRENLAILEKEGY